MNSSSSADSGPLSSRPAGRRRAAAGSRLTGRRRGRRASRSPSRSRPGLASLLLAEPAELRCGAGRCAARAAPASRGSRRPGRGRPPRGTPRPSRVGLRHQRVVARLAVELDQLAQAADVGGVALDDLLEDRRPRGRSGGAPRACPRPAGPARRPRRSAPRRGTRARAAGARPRPRGPAASRASRTFRASSGRFEPRQASASRSDTSRSAGAARRASSRCSIARAKSFWTRWTRAAAESRRGLRGPERRAFSMSWSASARWPFLTSSSAIATYWSAAFSRLPSRA